jgi:hypothetical protein
VNCDSAIWTQRPSPSSYPLIAASMPKLPIRESAMAVCRGFKTQLIALAGQRTQIMRGATDNLWHRSPCLVRMSRYSRPMEIEPLDWAGVLEPSMLSEAVVAARHRLADAARAGDWDGVLTLLRGGSTHFGFKDLHFLRTSSVGLVLGRHWRPWIRVSVAAIRSFGPAAELFTPPTCPVDRT